jgi:hypothetical protein
MANRGFKILPKNYLEDWGEFESFNGTFPEGWLVSTAGTYSQDTTNKKWGLSALGVSGPSSSFTVGGVYRTIPSGSDYAGRTFKLGFWAKSSSTGPYIELNDGVSSKTYHADGLNAFSFLTTPSLKLDISATQIRIDLRCTPGATVVFDSGVLCEGEDLFTAFNANIDVSEFSPSMSLKTDQYQIANKEGSYIPEYHLDANTIRMNGNVVGTDVTSCRNNFDSLLKAILSWQKTEKRCLYLYDDRIFDVFLKSFDWQYKNTLQMIKYNMAFVVPDGSSRSIGAYRKRQVTAGTATEFNFNYNGNAESLPKISFIADQGSAITTCSLQNLTNGQNLAYTGTVPSNVALNIDCSSATVFNSGVDKIADFTGDFLSVIRGTNYFRYTGTPCTVYIDYFERYF